MRPIMRIPWDRRGIMRSRPNRFLALVDIEEKDGTALNDQRVHVRDPGRLKELLYPGSQVLAAGRPGPGRKTAWELIAARDSDEWVLVNSGYHRAISEAILRSPDISPFGRLDGLRAEVPMGHSRLDFILDIGSRKIALEVKGCTLVRDGTALFPDAPTERGTRHLRTLIGIRRQGQGAAVLFLVFRRNARRFRPNTAADPEFALALKEALDASVEMHALKLAYDMEGMGVRFLGEIPVLPG